MKALTRGLLALTLGLVGTGCGSDERTSHGSLDTGGQESVAGAAASGGSGVGGTTSGGTSATGGAPSIGGVVQQGTGSGSSSGGLASGGTAAGGSSSGGGPASGGVGAAGTASSGGSPSGGTAGTSSSTGGTPAGGSGATGGSPTGGTSSGGTEASGGSSTGGTSSGGTGGGGGSADWYPCGSTTGYDAVATKEGNDWTVVHGSQQVYSGGDLQAALTAAYGSLTAGRTTKESILVQGDGDISATAQFSIPSYTILNVCGTINVSGTPSGSDRSPLYARGKTDIDIPNLKMTGSPQYGIFFRETNNVHLGQIDLRLTSSAGIGIRVDSGSSASTMTTFNTNLTIDYVYGSGMGSHIVETYGIENIVVGTVEGSDVGECGLLLNRSINAEIGTVSCDNCAAGTGYAAFRVANSVGKIGNEFPAGNIHVGTVVARAGGRGIFSVSGCGGLTIDQIDIANTGNSPILLQNTYNTTIAAASGTVVGGLVQISNDTTNTNNGKYPPSQNIALKNLTLSGGASIRQDWCAEFGANGCTATNITGGTVSMCN